MSNQSPHPHQAEVNALAVQADPIIEAALLAAADAIAPCRVHGTEIEWRAYFQALCMVQFRLAMRSLACQARVDLDLRAAMIGLVDALWQENGAALEALRLQTAATVGGKH